MVQENANIVMETDTTGGGFPENQFDRFAHGVTLPEDVTIAMDADEGKKIFGGGYY